jgi:nuclear protein localization family protein 4
MLTSLRHGDKLYMGFDEQEQLSNGHTSAPAPAADRKLNGQVVIPETPTLLIPSMTSPKLVKNPWDVVKQSALDDRLDKQDGKIKRPKYCRL